MTSKSSFSNALPSSRSIFPLCSAIELSQRTLRALGEESFLVVVELGLFLA